MSNPDARAADARAADARAADARAADARAADARAADARAADARAVTGRSADRLVLPVVGCFVVLALVTNIMVPIFDAPDEPSHFAYSRLLAQGKGLPVQTDPARRSEAEGFNPPLYYALGAVVLSAVDGRRGADLTLPPEESADWDRDVRLGIEDALDESLLPPRNPEFNWWERGTELNRFRHPPGGPASLTPLFAVHAMRLLSILCGVFTLLAVSRLARVLLPDEPAARILALAVVAFNPQFIFLSATLNNDNLATAAATWTLWRLGIALGRDDSTRGATLRDAVWIGGLLGIGMATKPSVLFLALPVAVVLFLRAADRRNAVLLVATVGTLMLAISGWFFVRNAVIYGSLDFFGWKTRLATQPQFTAFAPLSVAFVTQGILAPAIESFWGWFGWMQIRLPRWQVVSYVLLSLLSLASLGAWWPRARDTQLRGAVLLFGSCVALNMTALVTFNRMFFSNQGRLLFPSIGAIALLIAIGFLMVTSKLAARTRTITAITVGTVMLLLAMRTLAQVLAPVYL